MKTDRLAGLLSILANTDKVTVQELADRFEVSKRTIFRDLEALSCAGIPIMSYPGLGGGVAITKEYKINNQVLTADDTVTIYTALNGLKSIDNNCGVTNLLAKLVPEREAALFSQSDCVIDLSSWFHDHPTQEKAAALREAIRNQQCIRLDYVSKKVRCLRVIEPHKLVFRQSCWYVYGFCHERQGFRLFRLNRIVTMEVLDKQFQMRPVDNIDFQKDYGRGLFSADYKAGPIEVVLEYEIAREFELTGKIDASYFEKNRTPGADTAQLRFYVTDLSWTADYIMGIAGIVRVVSPPELFTEIKHRLEKIYMHYKG